MCEQRKTVLPSLLSPVMMSRSSLRPMGSEPAQGLVEEDEFGVVDERLGQPDPLQHAPRELAKLEARRPLEPDPRQEPRDPVPPLGPLQGEEAAVEVEELRGGEIFVEVGLLGQVAEPAPGVDVPVTAAEDLDLAGVGRDQPEGAFQGRGLARPVGAEKAEDLARCHAQRDALQGGALLGDKPRCERLMQVVDTENGSHRTDLIILKERLEGKSAAGGRGQSGTTRFSVSGSIVI